MIRLEIRCLKKKKAIQEAYWTCKGFWARPLPLEMKRSHFLGMVVNTALSGLEAECPTYKQVEDNSYNDKFMDPGIFIGYAQILSSITETCSSSTSWGSPFTGFSQAFGIVNLDITSLFHVFSCSMNFNFHTKLRLHFATPLAIIAAVKLAELVAIAATSKAAKKIFHHRVQRAYSFKILMTFLLLIYPVRDHLDT